MGVTHWSISKSLPQPCYATSGSGLRGPASILIWRWWCSFAVAAQTGGGCRAIAEAQMVISAMAVTGFHLVAFSSSPNALFPPQSPISSKDDHHQQKQEQKQLQSSLFGFKTYRRDAALLSFLALIPGLHRSSPATALTLGICTHFSSSSHLLLPNP